MNDTFLLTLKQKLESCISDLFEMRSLFWRNPEADFSRSRKISFHNLVNMLIQTESRFLLNELMEYFDHDLSGPTTSAFIQQRAKLAADGMAFLLSHFNDACRHFHDKTMNGYQLLTSYKCTLDLLNHIHVDIDIQGEKKLHERLALNHMSGRYHGAPLFSLQTVVMKAGMSLRSLSKMNRNL